MCTSCFGWQKWDLRLLLPVVVWGALLPVLAQVLQPERLTKQQIEKRVCWSREYSLRVKLHPPGGGKDRPVEDSDRDIRRCCPKVPENNEQASCIFRTCSRGATRGLEGRSLRRSRKNPGRVPVRGA